MPTCVSDRFADRGWYQSKLLKAHWTVQDATRQRRTRPRVIHAKAGPGTLTESAGELTKIAMTAYTGAMIKPSGWRQRAVVEIAGIQNTGPVIPILRQHDPERILGHGETRVEQQGHYEHLMLSGVLSGPAKHVGEFRKMAKSGFPWQASIGGEPLDGVEIARGKRVFVNSRWLTGPFLLVNSFKLVEISAVTVGADTATKTRVAAANPKLIYF